MLKFGFIGLGQVGGLFVNSAKLYGYKAMAINTANVDLNVLNQLGKEEKIHLSGYEGAGKDRSVGLEAFLEHQEMLSDRCLDYFQDCHIIFPVLALGGGTGSGIAAATITMLATIFDDKVISPIVFLPDEKEAPRAKMNALEAFSEISAIEEIGAMFVLDNTKILNLNPTIALKEKYKYTINDFLKLLDLFNRRTTMESEISNLDKMDLLTVFSERGSAMLAGMVIENEEIRSPDKMAEKMLRTLQFSAFAKSNIHNISKAALVMDIPTSLTAFLTIESIFKKIGMPLEVFSGIFEKEEKPKLYTLLTGLPFPVSALKTLEEDVKKEEKRIVANLEQARNQSFEASNSWTNSLKRKRKIKV